MARSKPVFGILLLALFIIGSAAADPFTGDFTGTLDGKEYRLSILGYAGRQYEGYFRAGGENLPLNARRFGDSIAGQIGIAELRFGFLAQVESSGLLFKYEDRKLIRFRRSEPAATVVEGSGVD